MWRERRLKEIAEAIKPAFAATDGNQWWLAGAESKPLPEPASPADPRKAVAYVSEVQVQQAEPPRMSFLSGPAEMTAEVPATPVSYYQPQELQSSARAAEAPAAPVQSSEPQQAQESAVAVEENAPRVPLYELLAGHSPSSNGRETRKLTWDSKRGCFV
jgi:hypothetical protein